MQRKVTIVNELGLHARSAGLIAKLAAKAKSRVWLERAGNRADAASILDILTLECSRGKTVTVTIEDAADAAVLDEIIELIENGFGE